MQCQTLPAILLACCLAGLLLAGPRPPLATPGPYLAGLVFAGLAAPNLIWQAAHGWPQLQVAANIAAGQSTSSASRWQIIPFQLVMIGPILGVVLVSGILALLRSERLRPFRWIGVAYLLLLVAITLIGGKPYYADSLVPAVFAAGVPPLLGWFGASRGRRALAGGLVAAHALGTALISLPVAPPGSAVFDVANAVNPDTGETVGWDRLTAQVARLAAGRARPGLVVLTLNYGEAGALEHARRSGTVLPPVFSGHNGFGEWGPPPSGTSAVIAVGEFYRDTELGAWFSRCQQLGTISTGVDDEEDGQPIQLCTGPHGSWSQLWPRIQRIG